MADRMRVTSLIRAIIATRDSAILAGATRAIVQSTVDAKNLRLLPRSPPPCADRFFNRRPCKDFLVPRGSFNDVCHARRVVGTIGRSSAVSGRFALVGVRLRRAQPSCRFLRR